MSQYDKLISSARIQSKSVTVSSSVSANLQECADALEALQAENKRLRAALERIACRHQSLNLLWWQEEAREALKGVSDVV